MIEKVLDWYRTSAVALVARGLLILAGFIFLFVVATNQATENARSDCWFNLVGQAVDHAPLHSQTKAQLEAGARHCARLPH